MKKCMFWREEKEKIRCLLCPHTCLIKNNSTGICAVRMNKGGNLYSLTYGYPSSIAPDPIEKKPLYHFFPGTYVLSFGGVGCNLKCIHCQNWTISQQKPERNFLRREMTPEKIVDLCKEYQCSGIAWTYNEPTIWYEYTYDGCKEAKKNGLYTAYVTNGFINEEPLKEISPYLDAMNIDVKAFTDEFYRKICSARLQPVLDTCKLAYELGIFIELTYLVIPTKNDKMDEIRKYVRWVADEISEDVPLHFSRFHPDYKMRDLPATPMNTLLKCYEISKDEGMKYVYLGNVRHGEYENTKCPKCGALLIERYGFSADVVNMTENKCKKCGEKINIIL